MTLHRLRGIELGVPDPVRCGAFYRELGLEERSPGRFSTAEGGEQLTIRASPVRRFFELSLGVDDRDDLGRIATSLARLGVPCEALPDAIVSIEPATGLYVRLDVAPRVAPPSVPPAPTPTVFPSQRAVRPSTETPAARPRKLGHVVMASPDAAATQRFFLEGLGLKLTDRLDEVGAAFMRCSNEHHEVIVQPGPCFYLHHAAWELSDVDAVGQVATRMLDVDPARHLWGLGRHTVGSNFFWYLRDPAGNFAECYSDLDRIDDEHAWTAVDWRGREQLYSWGPPPPIDFLLPPDVFPSST